MIGFLRGTVQGSDPNTGKALVFVGSLEAGVGYCITHPRSSRYSALLSGSRVELEVYSHIREDAFDLYGFLSTQEKDLFETLISVNGIGPKAALSILSALAPEELIRAIVLGEKDRLTAVPGVGKKTAERIVLELSGVLKKKLDAGTISMGLKRLGVGNLDPVDPSFEAQASLESPKRLKEDARQALVGLGYRESDFSIVLDEALSHYTTPPRSEVLIRDLLRRMS